MLFPPEFHEGLRLFAAGHFWHAHEQWEHCWLRASGPDAQLYQALIQTAAALVKWQQGNRRGLALNWAKGRARIDALPAGYRGVDLAALRAHMERLVAGDLDVPPAIGLAPEP